MQNFPDSLKKRLSVKIIIFLPTISLCDGLGGREKQKSPNKITCVKKWICLRRKSTTFFSVWPFDHEILFFSFFFTFFPFNVCVRLLMVKQTLHTGTGRIEKKIRDYYVGPLPSFFLHAPPQFSSSPKSLRHTNDGSRLVKTFWWSWYYKKEILKGNIATSRDCRPKKYRTQGEIKIIKRTRY